MEAHTIYCCKMFVMPVRAAEMGGKRGEIAPGSQDQGASELQMF